MIKKKSDDIDLKSVEIIFQDLVQIIEANRNKFAATANSIVTLNN
jgi:hypothetical protein